MKSALADSYPNRFPAVLPPEIFNTLAYYELVIRINKGAKTFSYICIGERHICLVDRGAKKSLPPIKFSLIEKVEKRDDRPDFLEDNLSLRSLHFIVSYRSARSVDSPDASLDVYTFQDASKLDFYLFRLWIGARLRLVPRTGSSDMLPSPRLNSGLASLSASEIQQLQQTFEDMRAEILGCKEMEDRLHVLDELAYALQTNQRVQKLFYERGEALWKLLLDQLRQYADGSRHPPTIDAKYSRDDQLEYLMVLLECMFFVLCDSEGIEERQQLLSVARPYSIQDAVALLVSLCPQASPATGQTDKLREVNDMAVAVLVQLESLAEQASMSDGSTTFSIGHLVQQIASTGSFAELQAPAMVRRLTDLIHHSQGSITKIVNVYEHARLLHMLVSRSPALRRQLMSATSEELRYFLADEKFLRSLDSSEFFAERSLELIQLIVEQLT